MLAPGEQENIQKQTDDSLSTDFVSQGFQTQQPGFDGQSPNPKSQIPQLMLYNESLGIRIMGINGAVIGRRQGPYAQQLQKQGYVSGIHAQLKYNPKTGWSIADKHSSNGTRLNDHQLQPDVEMSLKNGDILSLANVPLKVSVN